MTRTNATGSPAVPALREHDQVPHFDVATLDGRHVRYADLWQRRQLVLVLVAPGNRADAVPYAWMLSRHAQDFDEADAELVITDEAVPGFHAPCAVVADRWGEILHIDAPPRDDPRHLPRMDELLEWVRFARMQCPECPP